MRPTDSMIIFTGATSPLHSRYKSRATAWALLLFAAFFTVRAHAQAAPTAVANIRISAFGGFSGNYTGLVLAKNGDITAGVDIGFRPFAGFYPMLEARGLYPIAKGDTVNLENAVAGIRLGRRKGPFAGYGDVLFGRGKLQYPNGYPDPTNTFDVVSNTSSVLSLGGGVDWDWTEHFGLKGDIQLQRYQTPVTTTGELFSKVFTVGVTYRLGWSKIR
jgi:hypothetical protein